MGDDGTRVPAPRVRAVGRSPSLARTVDAALLAPGTPTLLTLVGPSGADVAVALDQLVLPAAHEHAASDRVRTATGLAWERGRAGGVLERLRLPADAHSLHLLSSAVHRLGPARVLVVVAATADRVEADSGALAELHRAHRGTSYAVEALDIAGVHELAAHAGVPLDESAARRLWRHTEGSPGLIAEILVQSDPQHWARLDARIPAARSAARAARAALAAADPEVRALVECCAVLGRWGTLAELRALSGLDDVLGPLDRAEASGLLQVRPGLRPLIGFPTRMARAAAYEATGVLRRHALHTRAAATLESPGEVLQHRCMAVLAPDPTLADDLVRHAADCAGRGSWRQAGQALLAAHRLATDPVVAEDCLIRSVDALVSAGDIVDAAALAPELESSSVSAARLGVQGYQQLLVGHRHEACELLHGAWAALDPGDAVGAATIAHRLALDALVDWDCPGLVTWADEAIARADVASTAALEARTMRGLGLAGCGRIDEALAEYEAVTRELPGGAQGQRAMMGQGWLHLALDRVPLASHELALSAPQEAWGGSTRVSLWAYGWLARARLALGDLAAAQAAVDKALPLLERTGQKVAWPLIHWSGAEVAALRGDWDLADHHAAQAACVPTDYQGMAVAAAMARASVGLARGDYAAVVRALGPLASGGRNTGIDEPGFWPWHDSYAIALVALGETAQADAFLRPHEELAASRRHASGSARLAAVRGRLQLAAGDLAAGRRTFEGALASIAGEPLPLLRARILYGYGQALRRAGKRRDAEDQLRLARQGFAAMGATTYVARCDRELKAGTRTRRLALTDLTPQERAVVELVVQGLSNGECAAALFVSIKTVQYHLTRVYARLGIRSRAELVALVGR